MMVEPGITKLSQFADSRYTLVVMAAKRARMLGGKQGESLVECDSDKTVSVAINEIAQGHVSYIRSDDIKKVKEYEAEKAAKIHALTNGEMEGFEQGVKSIEMEHTENDVEADDIENHAGASSQIKTTIDKEDGEIKFGSSIFSANHQ